MINIFDSLKRAAVPAILLGLAVPLASPAASLTWDSTGASPANAADGSGTWDTTLALWSNGSSDSAWVNANNDTAVFGNNNGAAGTVTLGAVTAGGIIFNAPGSGAYTLSSGTLTLGGSTPTINANVGATIGSVISGTSGLIKSGTGTLVLSATNSTYTGGTTITGGTLSVSNIATGAATASGLGIGNKVTLDGGTLLYNPTAANFNALNGGTLTLGAAGGTLDYEGAAAGTTFKGTFATVGSGARTLTLTTALGNLGGAGAIYQGVIADGTGGATSLVKNGIGSWFLSGANTYTGTTTINAGILGITAGSNRLPVTTTLVVSGSGTFTVAGLNQTVASLQGSGRVTNGTASSSGVLTVGSGSFSGALNDGGTGRVFGLTKATSGTMIVSGTANVYTGATTVSAGTLLVNNPAGSGLGQGAITVTSAVLGGTGFIVTGSNNGTTVGSGGVIAPGDPAASGGLGALTLSGTSTTGAILTMNAGSSFAFDLGASNANDTLAFYSYAGASDFVRDAGGVTLNFNGAQAGTFDLFRFYSDTGTTLTAAGFTEATSNFSLGSGLTGFNSVWDYSTTGVISLTLTAVPEPSSAVLIACGLGAVFFFRRRRS